MKLRELTEGISDKKKAQIKNESQQLNEWVWLIPALATAARIGGSHVARLMSKQAAKKAAQAVAKNTAKATAATGKAIIKNPGKTALAVGGYEVYDTVTDAMDWLKELDVAADLIKPLADVMVRYAIPAAAVLAVLYGGKKLYDYFTDEEPATEDAEDNLSDYVLRTTGQGTSNAKGQKIIYDPKSPDLKKKKKANETATPGATSAANIASVPNPVAAHSKPKKKGRYGAPKAPQATNPDGTAKNALDVNNGLMGTKTIKR
jgi:hypothetical protein